MNKLKSIGTAVALAIAATGCVSPGNVVVPSSDLSLSIFGEKQRLILPKDQSFGSLSLRATKGTNSVRLKIVDMKSANSSDVISQAFLGQAKLLEIQGQMLKDALQQIVSAAKAAQAEAEAYRTMLRQQAAQQKP